MKFGKVFQFVKVKEFRYISYDSLKLIIKEFESGQLETDREEAEFGFISPEESEIEEIELVTEKQAEEEISYIGSDSDHDTTKTKYVNRFYTLLNHSVSEVDHFYSDSLYLCAENVNRLISQINQVTAKCKQKEDLRKKQEASMTVEGGLSEARIHRSTILSDSIISIIRKRVFDTVTHIRNLQHHSELNLTALRKICKKADRRLGSVLLQSSAYKNMSKLSFSDTSRLEDMLQSLGTSFAAFSELEAAGGRADGDREWHGLLEAVDSSLAWRHNPYLVAWAGHEAKATHAQKERNGDGRRSMFSISPRDVVFIFIAIAVGLALALSPLPIPGPARRALGMLAGATILWATEAVPLYVTALSIPVLSTVGRVCIVDDSVLLPSDAAGYVLSHMMSGTILLVLGGFSLSIALSKYGIDQAVARWVLCSLAKSKPYRFIALLMCLNFILSAVVSNVTAPVLCISLVLPILRSLPANSRFSKTVVLSICLSGNIAGMASPLASPQAAVSVGVLDDAGYPLSFLQFMLATWPPSLLLLIVTILLLVIFTRIDIDKVPDLPAAETDSLIPATRSRLKKQQRTVLAILFVSVGLWVVAPTVPDLLAPTSIVSLAPVLMLFGTGLLDKSDIMKMPWPVVLLLMGGSTLGSVIQCSNLLDAASDTLTSLGELELAVTLLILALVMTAVAAFVSHTVSALLLLPAVLAVGVEAGHPRLAVMSAAFMASCTSPLPVSSFPNISCLAVEKEGGEPYLTPGDVLRWGGGLTVLGLIADMTVGTWVGQALGF
eukprot:gnl/Dysnectes_brevis/3296_a4135_766.p1 GENE.gnl/Dysnectes_brevis/3296_a4135_766~~gnl/Dysnectes_brevis/3296_a4135_766.p1  ORF type:complete len:779 (-),score=289.35 gnl/Dysnectes_brevis/3296_a4135_766:256-2592(-)